jgi:methionyl-tRNA synthetase
VRIVAAFTAPVMPATSTEVWKRLGLGDVLAVTSLAEVARWGQLPVGNAVEKGDPLFPRIVDEPAE